MTKANARGGEVFSTVTVNPTFEKPKDFRNGRGAEFDLFSKSDTYAWSYADANREAAPRPWQM